MTTPNFPVGDATQLAHAMLGYLAGELGIRVLSIKGPIPQLQGLRPPRTSQDADVLIDPARVDEFAERLSELGWNEPYLSDAPDSFPSHSRTLLNAGWPCSIDAHSSYPGIFATPSDAFELLWSRRVTVTLAGREVTATDRLGSICISGLHSLREPEHARSVTELEQLARVIRDELSPPERQELLELVSALRSRTTLGPLLADTGFTDVGDDLTELEKQLWTLRTFGEPKTLAWLLELRSSNVLRWPGIVRRALFPPEDFFRVAHPEVGPGRAALWRGYGRRLWHGISGVPAAIGVMVRSRR